MSCTGNREETAGRTNHVEFAYCQDRLPARTMHDRNGFIDQLHQACVGQFVNVIANEETHRPGTPSRFSRIIFNSLEDFERELDGTSPQFSSNSEDDDRLATSSSRWQGAGGAKHSEPRVCGVYCMIVAR